MLLYEAAIIRTHAIKVLNLVMYRQVIITDMPGHVGHTIMVNGHAPFYAISFIAAEAAPF